VFVLPVIYLVIYYAAGGCKVATLVQTDTSNCQDIETNKRSRVAAAILDAILNILVCQREVTYIRPERNRYAL